MGEKKHMVVKKIFPDFDFKETRFVVDPSGLHDNPVWTFKASTYVRLRSQSDGMYYLTPAANFNRCTEFFVERTRLQTIQELVKNATMIRECGIVSVEIKDTFKNPLFELDKDQRSEGDRLLNIFR